MSTKLIVELKDITPEWIADLQQQYSGATLEISIRDTKGVAQMNDEQFWNIISLLDWQQDQDDLILQPAVETLKQYAVDDIYYFQDILAEKLFELDRQVFAEQIGDRKYGGDKHFSVDIFLYARACVVANGKDFFTSVLHDPTKMPKSYTFEALLYLAAKAYEDKTALRWTYLPKKSYETFSNRKGWKEKSWMAAIL